MPLTAQELDVKNILDPEENIRGATAYLEEIYDRFDEINDSVQRIKFTLGSYNAGEGHVRDAQRMAKAMDDNVENALLKLRKYKYYTRPEIRHGFAQGNIPYNYVRDIFDRYEHYRKLILLNPEEETKLALE